MSSSRASRSAERQLVHEDGLSFSRAREDETPAILQYWSALVARWNLVALCVVVATLMVYGKDRFLTTPYYRATAVIRPVSPQAEASELTGLGGMLGGSELGGLFGMSSQADRAHEYTSILTSYAFTMALSDHGRQVALDVAQRTNAIKPSGPHGYPQWQLYKLMGDLFDCDFDALGGNVTMHYMDPDPMAGKRILQLYVDRLRDLLRGREIQTAQAASASIEEAARKTGDTLLQVRLYELLASQVQREKLAEVQADFAFIVIEPPVVPDKPYTPHPVRDCLLAAFLALLAASAWVVITDTISRSRRRLPLPGRDRHEGAGALSLRAAASEGSPEPLSTARS